MPSAPTAVHEALDQASFHLLFLAEGFRAADKKEFTNFCTKVSRALFRIAPFSLAERRISISSFFSPSVQQGVGAAPANTAFKFTLSVANELRTREPARIITAVKDVSPVPVGGGVDINPPLTGADVWIDAGRMGARAVCVVVREATKAATTTRAYATAADIDAPADQDDVELNVMLPFIAMSTWPTLAASVPQYVNPYEAAAAVLARELGIVCGLEYESELKDAAHEFFDPLLPDPDAPNLITDAAIRAVGLVDVKKVPWVDIMSATRAARPVTEMDHPVVTVAGETSQQEFNRFAPVREAMNTNIVLLRHPQAAGSPNDTSALTETRYQTLGTVQLINDDPHLIEGGGGYRRDIYRPSVECTMRFEGSDTPSGGKRKRIVVPFCGVCSRHIQKQLSGPPIFKLQGFRVIGGSPMCPLRAQPSELADRIVADIKKRDVEPAEKNGRPWPVDGWLCTQATIYRYEHFFQEVLGWSPVYKADLAPNADYPWYADPVPFPYVRNALIMWRIWQNSLDRIKEKPWLWRWAGLGAAGAIQFARLGCIANPVRPLNENDLQGKKVKIGVVRSLTLAELANLTPGAVLQLWKDETYYLDTVRYVVGVNATPPTNTGQEGHSLFFMGKNDNDEPMVADQSGKFVRLVDSNGGGLNFRIAAQWYPAVHVPELPAEEP